MTQLFFKKKSDLWLS